MGAIDLPDTGDDGAYYIFLTEYAGLATEQPVHGFVQCPDSFRMDVHEEDLLDIPIPFQGPDYTSVGGHIRAPEGRDAQQVHREIDRRGILRNGQGIF
jgi:hypothetical protein